MDDAPQVCCPRGYRGRLPCPGCTCTIQEGQPAPLCGTDRLVPCATCSGACPYREHSVDLRQAEERGQWSNGDPVDNPWGPAPGSAPAPPQGLIADDYSFGYDDYDSTWGGATEPVDAGWQEGPPPMGEAPPPVEEWGPPQAPWDDEPEHILLDPSLDPLEGLNPDQREVATHVEGPCGVFAGAGSGKTKSVISRIVYLLAVQKVDPELILAITFTRKAAHEMRERIGKYVHPEIVKKLRIQTYHSCALRILRSNGAELQLPTRFSMWDETATKRRMRDIISDIVDKSDHPKARRDYTAADLLTELAKHKEGWTPERANGLTPEQDVSSETRRILQELADRDVGRNSQRVDEVITRRTGRSVKPGDYAPADVQLDEMGRAQRTYENLKRTTKAVDFADLIYLVVSRSHHRPDAAKRIGARWSYIIVDEYQDSNDLQESFIRLLAGGNPNVMVVGDDDQSIYGWRGARVTLITTFVKRWEARAIFLGQNYRSWSCIVESADAVIQNNDDRVPKRLWSERGEGGAIYHVSAATSEDETYRIALAIERWLEGGWEPRDIAVLVRKRKTMRFVGAQLQKRGVPFIAVGVKPWWQTQDVQLVLSWLQILANPTDLDSASHILSSWPRMGPGAIKSWQGMLSGRSDTPMLGEPLLALHTTPRRGVKTKVGQEITRCNALYQKLSGMAHRGVVAVELARQILNECGITEDIERLKEGVPSAVQQAEDRLLSLEPFMAEAARHEAPGIDSILSLVDEITTQAQLLEEDQNAVTLSTMHGSKGLEWPLVVGASLVDGEIPTPSSPTTEERRLFYVMMTRARDILVMSSFWSVRFPNPMPASASPFVDEACKAGHVRNVNWGDLYDLQPIQAHR
jgi:DNA helicase-2/ATP-dependent DNA helicase PcrA